MCLGSSGFIHFLLYSDSKHHYFKRLPFLNCKWELKEDRFCKFDLNMITMTLVSSRFLSTYYVDKKREIGGCHIELITALLFRIVARVINITFMCSFNIAVRG